MKKILLLLALSPALLFAQTTGFTISGKVQGLKDGEVMITSTQENQQVVAKGSVQGGVFLVKGAVPEPGLYWLVMSNEQPQHIYLENRPIKITGEQKNIKNIKIEGSQSHLDFESFRKVFNPLLAELNVAGAQLQKAESEKKRDHLMKAYDSMTKIVSEEVNKFVSSNRSSYVSPFVLFITAQLSDDVMLLEKRHQLLDSNVRYSGIGKALSEYIAYNKVGAVGTDAVDFTQNDPSGNPVSLASYKGKYVLVDFWASWCKPCRMENPNVVKAYNRFKDKNFTVLGVSLDQQKEAWIKAIEKDNLTWGHVSDLQAWSNAVAQQYRISSIPQNFLIDPNGKIIAKNLREEQLQTKLCELLGCN